MATMTKKFALLPVALLSLAVFALPAAADDGTANQDQSVTDPGVTALHGAVDTLRSARSAEDACRGAALTDDCKGARSEARSLFQTVRADAIAAHKQFSEKVQALKDAKTPEEKAAVIAELKSQVAEAKAVMEQHQTDHAAMRKALNEQIAKLDPKLRDAARRQAESGEQDIRSKNGEELVARVHQAGTRSGSNSNSDTGSKNDNNGNNNNSGSNNKETGSNNTGSTNDNGSTRTGDKPSGSPRLLPALPSRTPSIEIHTAKPSASPTR
jgi:hypothetical protein